MTTQAAQKRTSQLAESIEDLIRIDESIECIQRMANRAKAFAQHLREGLDELYAARQPPRYTQSQLARIIGIDKASMSRRINNPSHSLPKGDPGPSGTRLFSVAMTREWARALGHCYIRKPGQRGFMITVGNVRGGGLKTTTAANLALGLSLKGYKILTVDFDSQGCLTNAMGVQPDLQVGENESFLPLVQDPSLSLRTVIRPTYWPGVDLVPASIELNKVGFFLPQQMACNSEIRFWSMLTDALSRDGIRDEYDYIIIDAAPSMSLLTLNALWAADGLLVPLPPESPDFEAAAHFWGLFGKIVATLGERDPPLNGPKMCKWTKVLATKVDHKKPNTQTLLDLIGKVYGEAVMRLEIPSTPGVSFADTEMGLVYDIARYSGSDKVYQRARFAYDELVSQIDAITRENGWGD